MNDQHTLQKRNKSMEELHKSLKDFVKSYQSLENRRIEVSLKQPNGNPILSVEVNLHHENEVRKFNELMIKFGFPKSRISGSLLIFEDSVYQKIFSNYQEIVKNAIEDSQLDNILSKIMKYAKEKSYRGIICKGKNFIRFQDVDFAKRAIVYLKSTHNFGKIQFDRHAEDVYFVNNNTNTLSALTNTAPEQIERTDEHKLEINIEEFATTIRRVITELFKFSILSSEIVGNERFVVNFNSENEMEEVQLKFLELDTLTEGIGSSLEFKIDGKFNTFEDYQTFYELNLGQGESSSISDNTNSTPLNNGFQNETIGEVISEEEFRRQVRVYYRAKGYKLPHKNGEKYKFPFTLNLKIIGDQSIDELAKVASIEKPEWDVSRVNPKSQYLRFSYKSYFKNKEILTKPEIVKPVILKPENIELVKSSFEIKDAIEIIAGIAKEWGFNYLDISPTRRDNLKPNSRTLVFQGEFERIREELIPKLINVGYEARTTSKYVHFESVFPTNKANLQPVEKTNSVKLEEKQDLKEIEIPNRKVSIVLTDAQYTSIRQSFYNELTPDNLKAELTRRGVKMFELGDISNDQLLDELKKRDKKSIQSLLHQMVELLAK